MIPVENGLVWLQNGEYERSHARDKKLRNDDEDVLYTLEARTCREGVRAGYPSKNER